MNSHPNATVAGVAGAITTLIVYLVGFAGIEPPAEASSAFTTILVALILLLGKRGPGS